MTKMFLSRYIIETISPLAINSGRREVGFDTQLARDVNNLPYIPSTSFTGVWRHLAQALLSEKVAQQWFGDLKLSDEAKRTPKLHIHHGLLLDGRGQVVLGLLPKSRVEGDDLLQRLAQARPHFRDHVRINDRGVATEMGKYDTILLPKGVRFCVDVRWQGDESFEASWQQVEELLTHPQFALGASTRNGLGRFKIIANETKRLEPQGNPSAGAELTQFIRREQLPSTRSLKDSTQQVFATLELKALDVWRSGKGTRPFGKADDHTDSFVYSEPYIEWQGQQGIWQEKPQAVLCGSSVKGILAHRLAYHYRRLTGAYAEDMAGESHSSWQKRPDALRDLLGDDTQDNDKHLAGRLIIEDVVVEDVQPMVRTHNSIDRFTGGVRMGALYSEEVLWQPRFTLKLQVVPGTRISPQLKEALEATLADLREGLLPLGAGSGRGNSLVIGNTDKWEIDWEQIALEEAV